MRTALSDEFGIDFALFAFNYQPDVVIEVCKAGGMGVLGAVRFTPAGASEALDYIEANIGGRPYGVDVVMPAKTEAIAGMDVDEMNDMLEKMIPQEHKDFVERVLDQYGVPKLPADAETGRDLLSWNDTEARQQVEISLERPDVKLIVNALGPPPADVVQQAHEAGVKVAALVGRKDHAMKQLANGVDIIVAQGTEAGGHSGEIATMVLVPEVVEAVGDHPVLAAGGIGNGRQVAASLALGAQGVWTGSMWLNTVECGQPDVMLKKFDEGHLVGRRALAGLHRQAGPSAAHRVDRGLGQPGQPGPAGDAAAVHAQRRGAGPDPPVRQRGAHGHPDRPARRLVQGGAHRCRGHRDDVC